MSNTHTHTRASQMAEWRDPATEVGDIEHLISLGPVQPRNIEFKGTDVLVSGQIKRLRFQEAWYTGRPWLEYSVAQDVVCCFYCRLFQPQVNGEETNVVICSLSVLVTPIMLNYQRSEISTQFTRTWWGFLNVAEQDRIESVINKAKRYG